MTGTRSPLGSWTSTRRIKSSGSGNKSGERSAIYQVRFCPRKVPLKLRLRTFLTSRSRQFVNHIFDGGSFRSEISTGLQYIVWSRVNKMREAFNDLKEACFLFWSALHFSGLDVTFDVISELHEHDEEYRMSVLRTYFSDDVLQLIETFNLPPHQVIRLFLFPPVNNRCRL